MLLPARAGMIPCRRGRCRWGSPAPRTRGDDPEDVDSPANIDLELGDDGQLWEMKNVGDGRHSVEGNMRDAYHKWLRLGLDADADARVVVTSYGASRDEREIIEEVRRRMRRYAAEAIYVLRDGSRSIFLKR